MQKSVKIAIYSIWRKHENTDMLLYRASEFAAVCVTTHPLPPIGMHDDVDSTGRSLFWRGALGFDTLAAQMVLDFQKQYPQIRLILVLPCTDQTSKWSPENQKRVQSILRRADKIVVLAKQYEPGCMQRRNRYLVDHSGVCVCYLTKNAGGTFYTVQYAKKNGLTVLHCALP